MTDDVITTGKTANPGEASGTVRVVGSADVIAQSELPEVSENVIILTDELLPSLVPLAKDATAILTYETTSLTSKAGVFARENGIPCVAGLESVSEIEDGDPVVVKASESMDTGSETSGKILRR